MRAHHDAPSSCVGGGDRVVELGRHRGHLGLGEHALEVQEAGLGEEVADLLGVVVDAERPAAGRAAAVARRGSRSSRARTPAGRRATARSTGSHATKSIAAPLRGTSPCPAMRSPKVDATSSKSSEHAQRRARATTPSAVRPSRSTSRPVDREVSGSRRRRSRACRVRAGSTPRAASAPVSASRSVSSANSCGAVALVGGSGEPGSPVDRRHRVHPLSGATAAVVAGAAVPLRGDGPFVGAEVAGDDLRIVAHGHRIALGDHAARLEAVDAVADAHDERHVVLDDQHRGAELAADLHDQRTERLGLALRDAGGRLVEAQHPRRRGRAGRPARRCAGCRWTGRRCGRWRSGRGRGSR